MVAESKTLTDIFGLSGKVGFVTGAGSGLGAEFCQALALAGADVVAADINLPNAEKTVASLIHTDNRKALALQLDVSNESAVRSAVDKAVAHFGHIDILFNNAGIADPNPRILHEYDSQDWRKVMNVNLDGVYYTAKAVLGVMVKQPTGGKVINIASMWGLVGGSLGTPSPAYVTAKGAVVNLTRELGLEYATKNIQVNALCPGFYKTHIANDAYDMTEFTDICVDFTPMGRIAAASEMSRSFYF
ncbi:hypothetical protein JAAARDRAFT_62486 [Jaapia argillacea MUCL 33604]|uniref:Uncharacterized protein n=1 Tax=Jaapia argillacea MUCL 33604 TaxID=933084 RepID=A0A067PC61_9AGAM|nr:hypothetical protein JAAARDRAFT_62486 [Jaapia argillacea MUCL 33604]